jgi:hypothetical protein
VNQACGGVNLHGSAYDEEYIGHGSYFCGLLKQGYFFPEPYDMRTQLVSPLTGITYAEVVFPVEYQTGIAGTSYFQ